jgi:hypothetical protein
MKIAGPAVQQVQEVQPTLTPPHARAREREGVSEQCTGCTECTDLDRAGAGRPVEATEGTQLALDFIPSAAADQAERFPRVAMMPGSPPPRTTSRLPTVDDCRREPWRAFE